MESGFDHGLVGHAEVERFDVPRSSHVSNVDPGRDLSAPGAQPSGSRIAQAEQAEIDIARLHDDESQARALELARSWDLPFLEAEELVVDRSALASLGPAQASGLRAIPVGYEDGTLRVVIDAPSRELFARVGEHYSEGVAFAVVTPAKLDRLLAPHLSERAGGVRSAASNSDVDTGLGVILSLLEDEASRISSIREKLHHINLRLAEKDQRLARLESELEQSKAQRRQDVATIARLHEDLAQRDALLSSVRAKVREFAAVLDPGNRP